jgi:hypothetical protein
MDITAVKKTCTAIDHLPPIKPDYTDITIPSNIAPMHFSLLDSNSACIAEFSSVNGSPILIKGKKGIIAVKDTRWKRLLSENAGNPLHITIYLRDNKGKWFQYTTIENNIAAEQIDNYCTYRLLNFQYSYWKDQRECQRDLTSFNEKVLVNTLNYSQNDVLKCVNCHTPMNNDPSRFVLQLRSQKGGAETLIADGDSIATLSSRLGHTAWHPSGKYIAFSVYKVQQYFHSVGRQLIDVYDKYSYIVIYDVEKRKIIPVPQLNVENMLETWPAWSPDGRYLYYCCAPVLWDAESDEIQENFNKTKYSLLRIAFDVERNSWGDVDTILAPADTGLSIALPRISPDNRFCIFTMQSSGAYPYINVTSDLYIMDIATKQYRKLSINSEYNESWHSWSKNGRWILFASRRNSGIFTRLYISYVDSTGNAHKPFVLPQSDPSFYDSFLKCYNVAEFAVSPVRFSERQLFKAIQSTQRINVPIPPKSGLNQDNTNLNSWTAGGRE